MSKRCAACGNECQDDTLFCEKCGNKLTEEENKETVNTEVSEEKTTEGSVKSNEGVIPEQLKNNKKVNKRFLIGTSVAVLILVFAVFAFFVVKRGFEYDSIVSKAVVCMYDDESEKTIFLVNDRKAKFTLDGKYKTISTSANGSTIIITSDEAGDNENWYIVTAKGTNKVSGEFQNAVVCYDGTDAVFVSKEEIYTVTKEGKAKKLASIDSDDSFTSYIISPDGDTIVYSVSSDNEIKSYINNSKDSFISKYTPVAVSNKAKYIYATKSDENGLNLYSVNKKGETNKIASSCVSWLFNNKVTQVMVTTSKDGSYITYLSKNGKTPESKVMKSSSSIINMLLPRNKADNTKLICPVASLEKKAYTDGSKVMYVKKANTDAEKITSYDSYVTVSFDYKMLYYKDGGDLCYRKLKVGADKLTVAEDISTFGISTDGKKIYYIDNDKTLFYKKGPKAKAKKVHDDVKLLTVTFKDIALYITDDETLYYAKTSKGKKIAGDVELVFAAPNFALYATDETAYISNGTKKFKKFINKP